VESYTYPQQTCICFTHNLRKVWKRLCICENEATIGYYCGFALKLINTCRRSLTQRLESWSIPVISKVWIKTQRRVEWRSIKNGSRRGDPNRSCKFSTLPLLVCVCR